MDVCMYVWPSWSLSRMRLSRNLKEKKLKEGGLSILLRNTKTYLLSMEINRASYCLYRQVSQSKLNEMHHESKRSRWHFMKISLCWSAWKMRSRRFLGWLALSLSSLLSGRPGCLRVPSRSSEFCFRQTRKNKKTIAGRSSKSVFYTLIRFAIYRMMQISFKIE